MLKRTKRQLLIILALILTLASFHIFYKYSTINNIEYSFYIDDNVDRYFGTKSRYPQKSEISGANLNINSKFKLRQIQLVCRHGTRYPTGTRNYNEKIEYLKNFLYTHSKSFPKEYSFLSLFENPYNESEYGLLDIQGIKDMQNLAKRALHRYSNITQTIEDLSNIQIYSTNVTRVVDSAAAFISTFKIHLDEIHKNNITENKALFAKHFNEVQIIEQDEEDSLSIDRRSIEYNEKKINMLLEEDIDNYEDDFSFFQNDELLKYINIYKDRSKDIILSPHIACPLFNEEINGDDKTIINNNIKELEDKYIHSVVNSIRKKLNIKEVPNVVGESIMSMCIFEVALNNTRNQFCSLIDKTSLENYGFYEDYRNYHIKGYYNEVNQWLATPLFKEIINDIDKEILKDKIKLSLSKRHNYNTNIVLRFAHAETIFPLITLLGLFKDKKRITMKDAPPKDNYIFRSTIMSPFAANFWFELYEIETKYIIDYEPKDDIIYVDNPFNNQNVTNILENLEEITEGKLDKTRKHSTTFAIRVLLNEKEISIPGCKPIEIVDLTTREKSKYSTICLLSHFKQNILLIMSQKMI